MPVRGIGAKKVLTRPMNPRLLVLCFGNFMIGTGTLIVPGMLPALAHGLGVDVPVAAQLITAFGFTVCVTAPPLAALTARFDRRALLVTVQLLFAAGHFATACAGVSGHELVGNVFRTGRGHGRRRRGNRGYRRFVRLLRPGVHQRPAVHRVNRRVVACRSHKTW